MVSEAQIQEQIKEVKSKLDAEWLELDEVFTKIKIRHDEVDQIKKRRDEFNQSVKTLINDGKVKQKERDKLHESVKPIGEVIKNLRLNIKEYAKQISELKDIRDGKHRVAKGSLLGLQDNIASSLTTLLTLDLSLKDEITLFNMIFSSKERFEAKTQAEDIHGQIQDIYKALKESEGQIQEKEWHINKIKQEAQERHKDSIETFKEKDDAREQSNKLHQQVLDGYADIKLLRAKTDDIKKNVSDLKNELNELHKKLRAGARKRQEMAKREKLESAKEKLKGEKKMDLNELRLLIESGAMKDK